jgi:hypothetical protein
LQSRKRCIKSARIEEIYEAAKVVKGFDPKPGRQYTSEEPTYITPEHFACIYAASDQASPQIIASL